MYLPGDGGGEATIHLLYGRTNPSGKLAETFPCKLADTPAYLNFPGENCVTEYREGVFVGYRYYDKKQMEVLFPFGHGLSYTNFAYWIMMVASCLVLACYTAHTGGGKQSGGPGGPSVF